MRKGDGAKAKMSRMQGRKESSCECCSDDVGLTTCGTCGGTFCRDCKIDHPCLKPNGDVCKHKNRTMDGGCPDCGDPSF